MRDGGELDVDGQANGEVRDPVALGVVQGNYTLQPAQSAFTLVQGGQGQVEVAVVRQNFTGAVTLSLEGNAPLATSPAPDKIAWAFNPNPAAGNSSTLTLQVGAQVPAGQYSLTLKGRAQGQPDRTATLTLAVQAQGGGGNGGTPVAGDRRAAVSAPFNNVTYGADRFVAVGEWGIILVSPPPH
ncbi:hypothetical protein TJA_24730 [Thermus sp. LT1-2-5]